MCLCWERSGLSCEHWAYLYCSKLCVWAPLLPSTDGASLKDLSQCASKI